MRIAIVGGNGFLGSQLVDRLREMDPRELESVRIVSRSGALPNNSLIDRRFSARAWNARTDPQCSWIDDVDILINLVGIKRPTSDNDFNHAHVEIPELLITAAERNHVQRIIHVSVAGCRAAPNRPYLDSKWAGENLFRQSKIPSVILRPGIIFGKGDDLLSNLVRLIRHNFCQFGPTRQKHNLQLVNGIDVATAIVQSIRSVQAVHVPFIDLVNSEKLRFDDLINRVSNTLGLRSFVVHCPRFLLVAAASLLEAGSRNPILTRAQLFLLSEGVEGDPRRAQSILNWQASSFSSDIIKEIVESDPRLLVPFLGFSLRLPSIRNALHDSIRLKPTRIRSEKSLIATIGMIAALMVVLPLFVPNIWYRVTIINLVQMAIVLHAWRSNCQNLLRPNLAHFNWGLLSAAILWLFGYLALSIGEYFFPQIGVQLAEIYSWTLGVPIWLSLILVVWTLTVEEVFWRGFVNFEMFERWGSVAIVLSSTLYAVAHLNSGPPLLVAAAFLLGLIWSFMAIRFRSLFLPWICHLTWDLLVLYVFPYPNLLEN